MLQSLLHIPGYAKRISCQPNVLHIGDEKLQFIVVAKDAVKYFHLHATHVKEAIQKAFINIGNTEEGQKIISIYSHKGYEIADDANYDGERDAQELIKSMQ